MTEDCAEPAAVPAVPRRRRRTPMSWTGHRRARPAPAAAASLFRTPATGCAGRVGSGECASRRLRGARPQRRGSCGSGSRGPPSPHCGDTGRARSRPRAPTATRVRDSTDEDIAPACTGAGAGPGPQGGPRPRTPTREGGAGPARPRRPQQPVPGGRAARRGEAEGLDAEGARGAACSYTVS